MLRCQFLLFFILVTSCAPHPPYTWQDTRAPARESAAVDMQACREFTSRQYQPGIPAGEPYLDEQKAPADPTAEYTTGEWRLDRDPLQQRSIDSLPTHDVNVEYTGYPGELDYHPDYLDDIFEKCMNDKGWEYKPRTED